MISVVKDFLGSVFHGVVIFVLCSLIRFKLTYIILAAKGQTFRPQSGQKRQRQFPAQGQKKHG